MHTSVAFLGSACEKINIRESWGDRRICINFKINCGNVQVAKLSPSASICYQLFKRGYVGVEIKPPVLLAHKFFDEQKVFLLVSLKEHYRILL